MATRRQPQPEPLQPDDEEIAREEVEGYYLAQAYSANRELIVAQERYDRARAEAHASIEAFRAGERLPELDAASIGLHAGGHAELGLALLSGRSTNRAAYDAAKARSEATERWLRSQGYKTAGELR